ncbi:hypothetical protein AOQ84DRAFT_370951 [Glonium stellatum]|uniref:Uncharacterized protein n=1 Tax=Glonium stellatum TaxID=574774 RepID=A0A8E2JYZ8_9PEZI|nr:hypothetical protein AOQ84DRAFT_370951 [Glonium stellatum]
MDKVKKVFHLRSKSKTRNANPEGQEQDVRPSHDSEIQNMDIEERSRYLKEIEEAEKTDSVKKGSWLDKLIAQGNKKTEDQLRAEQEKRERKEKKDGVIH